LRAIYDTEYDIMSELQHQPESSPSDKPSKLRGCCLGLGLFAFGFLCYLFILGVMRVKYAAGTLHSQNNLRNIAIAMHAYRKDHGTLPPPAVYDQEGKPLLSWRILLLPYLESDNLFKLDQPWDSPHNLRLLRTSWSPIYRAPDAAYDEAYPTHYQVIVGEGAAFEERRTFKLDDFPDGLPNTILVAEAADPVPWTKPQDVRFSPKGPLPKFGGLFSSGFNVVFADGAVRFLKYDIDEKTLRALITRNGNDGPIDLD
jgi:hypothetical protein